METKITMPFGEKVEFDRYENGTPFITVVSAEKKDMWLLSKEDIIQLRDFLNQLEIE